MLAEEVAEEIGKDVIDDDEHSRNKIINDTFKDIAAHKPGGTGADESGNHYPAEKSELVLQESLFETEDKSEEADYAQRKADKIVIEK